MAYSTAKALVADLAPAELRGTAYGRYIAIVGVLDFPASAIAGVLWQGIGSWQGFGPSAPFIFGGVLALHRARHGPLAPRHAGIAPAPDAGIGLDLDHQLVAADYPDRIDP